jgi:hypothetical protein
MVLNFAYSRMFTATKADELCQISLRRDTYLMTKSWVVISLYTVHQGWAIFGQRYNFRNTEQTVWNSTKNNYFTSIRAKTYQIKMVKVRFVTSVSDKFYRSVTFHVIWQTLLEVVLVNGYFQMWMLWRAILKSARRCQIRELSSCLIFPSISGYQHFSRYEVAWVATFTFFRTVINSE